MRAVLIAVERDVTVLSSVRLCRCSVGGLISGDLVFDSLLSGMNDVWYHSINE